MYNFFLDNSQIYYALEPPITKGDKAKAYWFIRCELCNYTAEEDTEMNARKNIVMHMLICHRREYNEHVRFRLESLEQENDDI